MSTPDAANSGAHVIDESLREYFKDAHVVITTEHELEALLARLVESPLAAEPASELAEYLNSHSLEEARQALKRLSAIEEDS